MESEKDPIAKLRGQVVDLASPTRRMLTPGQVFGIFVSAWNVYHGGRPLIKAKNFPTLALNAPRPNIHGFPDKLFIESQSFFQGFDDDED